MIYRYFYFEPSIVVIAVSFSSRAHTYTRHPSPYYTRTYTEVCFWREEEEEEGAKKATNNI